MAVRKPPSGGRGNNARPTPPSSGGKSAGNSNAKTTPRAGEESSRERPVGNPARRAGIADTRPHNHIPEKLTPQSGAQNATNNLHQSTGISHLRSHNARGEQNYGEHRGQREHKGTDIAVRSNIAKQNIAREAEYLEEEKALENAPQPEIPPVPEPPPIVPVSHDVSETYYEPYMPDVPDVPDGPSGPSALKYSAGAYAAQTGGPPYQPEPAGIPPETSFPEAAHSPSASSAVPERSAAIARSAPDSRAISPAASHGSTASSAEQTVSPAQQREAAQRVGAGGQGPQEPPRAPDAPIRDAHRKAQEKRPQQRKERQDRTNLGKKRETQSGGASKKRAENKAASARKTLDRSGKMANKAEEIRARHKRAFSKGTTAPKPNAVRDRYAKAAIVKKNVTKQKEARADEKSAVQKNAAIRQGTAAVQSARNDAATGQAVQQTSSGSAGRTPNRRAGTSSARSSGGKSGRHVSNRGAASVTVRKTSGAKSITSRPVRNTGSSAGRHTGSSARSISGGSQTIRSVRAPLTLAQSRASLRAGSDRMHLMRAGRSARAIKASSRDGNTSNTTVDNLAKRLTIGRLKRQGRSAREVAVGAMAEAVESGNRALTKRTQGRVADAQEDLERGISKTVAGIRGAAQLTAAASKSIRQSVIRRKAKKTALDVLTQRNLQRSAASAKAAQAANTAGSSLAKSMTHAAMMSRSGGSGSGGAGFGPDSSVNGSAGSGLTGSTSARAAHGTQGNPNRRPNSAVDGRAGRGSNSAAESRRTSSAGAGKAGRAAGSPTRSGAGSSAAGLSSGSFGGAGRSVSGAAGTAAKAAVGGAAAASGAALLQTRRLAIRNMMANIGGTHAKQRAATNTMNALAQSTLSGNAVRQVKKLWVRRSAYNEFGKSRNAVPLSARAVSQRRKQSKGGTGGAKRDGKTGRGAAGVARAGSASRAGSVTGAARLLGDGNTARSKRRKSGTIRQLNRLLKRNRMGRGARRSARVGSSDRAKRGGRSKRGKTALRTFAAIAANALARAASSGTGSGGGNSAENKTQERLDELAQSAGGTALKSLQKLQKRLKHRKIPKTKLPRKTAKELQKMLQASKKATAASAKAAGKAAGAAAGTAAGAAGKATAAAAAKAAQAAGTAGQAAHRAIGRVLRKSLTPLNNTARTLSQGRTLTRAGRQVTQAANAAVKSRNLISAGKQAAMRAKSVVKKLFQGKGGVPGGISGTVKGAASKIGDWFGKIAPKIMRGNVLNRILPFFLGALSLCMIALLLSTLTTSEWKATGDTMGAAVALNDPEAAEMRTEMEQKLLNEVINPKYYALQGDGRPVQICYNANSGYAENYNDYQIPNFADAVAIFLMKTDLTTPVDRHVFDEIWDIYQTINPVSVRIGHEEDEDGNMHEVVYLDVENWQLPDTRIQNRFGFTDEQMETMVHWIQPPDDQAYWFNKLLGLDVSYWELGPMSSDYLSMFAGISPTEAVYRLLQECTKYDGWQYSQPKRTQEGYRDCSSFVSSCFNIFDPGERFFGEKYATTDGIIRWCENQGVLGSCNGDNYMEVLQPGDIIFWNTNPSHYKSVGHVAIYAGNGMMWESAPSCNGVTYREVRIQRRNKIFAYGRPLALSDRVHWDGTVLPMGGGGGVMSGTGQTIVVPQTFAQTGICGDATSFTKDRWSWGMGQLQRLWESKGRTKNGHFCTLDGYFMVATSQTFGGTGDVITVFLENGKTFQAVITDTKRSTDSNSHKYGHLMDGKVSCIEWEVDYGKSTVNTQQLKKELQAMGFYGSRVVKIVNHGNKYAVGG